MNAMLEREQAHERARRGLAVNKSLVWYPASLRQQGGEDRVRHVGSVTTTTVRIFAARMRGDTVTASRSIASRNPVVATRPRCSAWVSNMRLSSSRLDREKPLKENQSYLVGKDSGVHKITLVSRQRLTADKSAILPTGEQVVQMAKDIGNSGTTYSKMARLSPPLYRG